MKTFKVTIIKAQPSMWYNDQIGQQKIVTNTSNIYYKVEGEKNKIIFKCDAIINQ